MINEDFSKLGSDMLKIIEFLRVARKLQVTYRFTPKPDNEFESDADHSWSVALICMLLASRLEKELGISINQLKMIKMAIIHDMAEIETGDTRTWDAKARIDKEQKERKAFYDMTEILPEDLKLEFRDLWEECEARKTIEAKIVKSIDRLDPVLHRTFFEVGWKDISGNDGTVSALDERQLPRHEFSEVLTLLYTSVRDEAIHEGLFNLKSDESSQE